MLKQILATIIGLFTAILLFTIAVIVFIPLSLVMILKKKKIQQSMNEQAEAYQTQHHKNNVIEGDYEVLHSPKD